MGDPILESHITRRVDFARFMVEAIEDRALIHEAPAVVGCRTPSALAHAAAAFTADRAHARLTARSETATDADS